MKTKFRSQKFLISWVKPSPDVFFTLRNTETSKPVMFITIPWTSCSLRPPLNSGILTETTLSILMRYKFYLEQYNIFCITVSFLLLFLFGKIFPADDVAKRNFLIILRLNFIKQLTIDSTRALIDREACFHDGMYGCDVKMFNFWLANHTWSTNLKKGFGVETRHVYFIYPFPRRLKLGKGLFTRRWGTPGRWGNLLRWGNPVKFCHVNVSRWGNRPGRVGFVIHQIRAKFTLAVALHHY